MNSNITTQSSGRLASMATAAALGSIATTLLTGVACAGPLIGILLGVSGMGFLAQYAYLRVPATVITACLLALGFYVTYRRAGCVSRRSRWAMWFAAVCAVAVNVFEYLVFPNL